MFGDGLAYRGLLGFFALMALLATVFGGFGVYTILTGGTTDGQVESNKLGEFDCETFDGDPAVGHQADYGTDRTVLGDSRLESFNTTDTGDGYRINITVEGAVLGVSASQADGTPVSVARDDNRISIEREDATPFRLWIDSVDDEATVTRSQLDICPPAM